MTGWIPGDGQPDTIYLARVDTGGRRRPVGAAQYGLDAAARARLREALRERERPARRRTGIRPVAEGISVDVDSHGRPDGWLRDPVLRAVVSD